MKKWTIAAAAVAVLAIVAYFALGRVADTEAKARVEQFAGEMRKHFSKFEYGDVKTAPLNTSVEIHDVRFNDGHGSDVVISTIVISEFDWLHQDMPRYGAIKAKGIIYSVDTARPENKWVYDDYGYDRLQGEMEMRYKYDDRAGVLDVHFYAAATGAGTVTYDIKLGSLDPDTLALAQTSLENNPMAAMALMQATLVGATLTYEDQSLAGRVMKVMAKRRAITEDDWRAETLKTLTASRDGAADASTRQVNDALITFVDKPRTITVTVSPKQPVSLMALVLSGMVFNAQNGQAAEKTMRQLGVKITAN